MLDILWKLISFVDFIYVCVFCGGENKIVRELQYFLQCSSVHNILHYLKCTYHYIIWLNDNLNSISLEFAQSF